MITDNTIKEFKTNQDMRYAGYFETESICYTLQKRVQKANNRFLEDVQHQTIVIPPFVDTNDQSTASMLKGNSSKMNLDSSTATYPIDSQILNQSVVTYPIDLENSN